MKLTSKQVDKKTTFQARIDRGWWKILSQLKTDTGKGFKRLIEDALTNTYGIGSNGKIEIYDSSENYKQAKNNLDLTGN